MDTETMIRELERVEEKHKHDKVFTGQLNVAKMAHDTRKRLEELKPYEDTDLTPEEIMELKERDTAVLPGNIMGGKKKGDLRFGTCPKCKRSITDVEGGNFCQNCGQRLKWED